MSARQFPIHPDDRKLLASVPWDLVAPHEAQAMRNHGGQSLEVLADRHGLDLIELAFVLLDRPYMAASPSKAARHKVREDALRLIKEFVREHEAKL